MDFLQLCENAAEAIEEAIRGYTGVSAGGEYTGMGADGTPTKKIDLVAERCFLRCLRQHPICRVLVSEELGTCTMEGEKGTIFLDPIDGTFNAVAGIPFYALSVAYAEDGIVRKGYVKNLADGETFYAELGEGAYLNGEEISVSGTSLLEESAMSVYGRKFDPTPVLHLGKKIRRWRLLGASAIELCYVASGRLDGFIDVRDTLRVTDAAAGKLICEEAGGEVTDLEGNYLCFPDEVTVGRCLIATNGILHTKVVEYLR